MADPLSALSRRTYRNVDAFEMTDDGTVYVKASSDRIPVEYVAQAEVDRWKQQSWGDQQEIMRLREVLRGLLDVAGTMHVAVEGPNARWRGGDSEDPNDLWYDDDLIPAPDCPVCAAEEAAREALDA